MSRRTRGDCGWCNIGCLTCVIPMCSRKPATRQSCWRSIRKTMRSMIGSSRSTIGIHGNSARRCRADGRPERSREAAAWHRRSRRQIQRRPFDNLRLSGLFGPTGRTFAPTADRSCTRKRSSPPVANHDRQTSRGPPRPHSAGYWPHRRGNVRTTGPRAPSGPRPCAVTEPRSASAPLPCPPS